MSSSVCDNLILNLSNFPSDVIRKIVRVGQESLHSMRVLSIRWNNLSLEHLNNRKRFPMIKAISVKKRWSYDWEVFVNIQRRFRNYFGVHKWTESLFSNETDKNVAIRLDVNNEILLRNVLENLFARCSHVDHLEFNTSDLLEMIQEIIGNITIGTIKYDQSVTSGKSIGPAILDFIRVCSVQRFVIAEYRTDWNPFRPEARWEDEIESLTLPSGVSARVETRQWHSGGIHAFIILEKIELS